MTVQQIVPYAKYVTNGADSVYTVNFFIEDKENLFIKLNDVVVSMNDYNYLKDVNGIEFHTPLLANQKLEIFRKTKLERTTNFESFNNTFRPEVLNKDLDKIWLTLQEQSSKVDQYDLDYEYAVRTSSQALTEVKDAQARADDAYELADLTNTEIRPIPRGGTGANNASDARNNLDVHSKAEVLALVQTGGAGAVLNIENGGTGSTTVEDVRSTLNVLSTDEIVRELNKHAVLTGGNTFDGTQLINGNLTISGEFTANLNPLLNATGDAPISACRAWVSFSGVSTITIHASQNIASITRTSTGTYQITFTKPMPHANYSILTGVGESASRVFVVDSTTKNITGFVGTYHSTGAGSKTDGLFISMGVFC